MPVGSVRGMQLFHGKSAGRPLDDTAIVGDIKAEILKDPDLKAFAIDVNSDRGNVTLSGRVPNRAAEERLIEYAEDTKGVKSVKTNFETAGYGGTGTAGTSQTTAAPVPGDSGTKETTRDATK